VDRHLPWANGMAIDDGHPCRPLHSSRSAVVVCTYAQANRSTNLQHDGRGKPCSGEGLSASLCTTHQQDKPLRCSGPQMTLQQLPRNLFRPPSGVISRTMRSFFLLIGICAAADNRDTHRHSTPKCDGIRALSMEAAQMSRDLPRTQNKSETDTNNRYPSRNTGLTARNLRSQ
jgi:hypothetical protein